MTKPTIAEGRFLGSMDKRKKILVCMGVLAVLAAMALVYRHWYRSDSPAVRAEMLSLLPADTSTVAFLDMAQLRSSPFFEQLLAWAPRLSPDADYAQFIGATGFNYERDLDRLAIASIPRSPNSSLLAIAEGRFDRKKIEAYATQ